MTAAKPESLEGGGVMKLARGLTTEPNFPARVGFAYPVAWHRQNGCRQAGVSPMVLSLPSPQKRKPIPSI